MIPRLALIATCVVGVSGFVAASAQASTVAVTGATSITPGSAVLHGTIATGGKSVSYSFLYDTVSDWNAGGDNASLTDAAFDNSGAAVLNVSAPIGCFPPLSCGPEGLPLSFGSKYIYFLTVTYGTGGAYYYNGQVSSGAGHFSTPKIGKLHLKDASIFVKKGKGTIVLKCNSPAACKGKWKITAHKHGKKVTCMSGKVSLHAGRSATMTAKVSGACLGALSSSKSKSIGGTFAATLTSGQPNVRHNVVLHLKKKH